ncbi:hypothetical protein FXF50_03575 [Micromonospora sp. AP08]|uniref:hypothetical protein n=1 Tax=Micromonospora sp. AP08 TaxID=2604467 RepID=UPI0011D5F93B|nr:hypothetical protein [Micromonospora sp. AP08]TYB39485.1 hypothetical protein FXF50_03575 [Micromonospora sp. AP08]
MASAPPPQQEPTNYLDFDSLEVVEAAPREFRGTVVMVSHDTWSAEAVGVDRRWRLGDGRLVEEAG